jgi:hypothetical protein
MDADQKRSGFALASFGAAAGLSFAALLLTGPLAVAVGAVAIAALVTGFQWARRAIAAIILIGPRPNTVQ